jgi:hypothetical protein
MHDSTFITRYCFCIQPSRARSITNVSKTVFYGAQYYSTVIWQYYLFFRFFAMGKMVNFIDIYYLEIISPLPFTRGHLLEVLPPFSTHVRSSRQRASSLNCGGGAAAGGYPPSNPTSPPPQGILPLVPHHSRRQTSSLQSGSLALRHRGILLPFPASPAAAGSGASYLSIWSLAPLSQPPTPPNPVDRCCHLRAIAAPFCKACHCILQSFLSAVVDRRWPDSMPPDTRVPVHVRRGPLELPMPLVPAAAHGREALVR